MKKNHSLFFFFTLSLLAIACTDYTSIPEKKYELIQDISKLTNLNSQVNESSGLEYLNGQIWTHNDSGDAPFLYQISRQSDSILYRILLHNSTNIDWEEIAEDTDFVYVADIGNNDGLRTDLAIYKVSKNDLNLDTIFDVKKIEFTYEDQANFVFKKEMHDYNAEALVNIEDSLFIFTKNHISQTTRCYNIPKEEGIYNVSFSREFPVEGLITSADYHIENKVLILLGYQEIFGTYQPFIWCFWDFENSNFFSGKSKRFNLNLPDQTEGITFLENGLVLISSEKEMLLGGNLWQIDLSSLKVGF